MSPAEIKSEFEWIAYEAAAWQLARFSHGLDRAYLPEEFATSAIVLADPHAPRILALIERIKTFVPSVYSSDQTYNEFRPR